MVRDIQKYFFKKKSYFGNDEKAPIPNLEPLYKLRETPHPSRWWLSFRREKGKLELKS